MQRTTGKTWIALAVGALALVTASCCLFTGMVVAVAPPPAHEEAPPTLPPPTLAETEPDLCAAVEPIATPFTREAQIDLDVIVGADRRPRLRIRTNLPAGTLLAVDLSEGDEPGGAALATDGRYHESIEIEVMAPCVVAGPFASLPTGRFTAMVVTPAFAQPEHVQRAFGREGRRLRGAQIHTVLGARVVEATARVQVP